MELTYKEIRRKNGALSQLAQRVLPSRESEQKVAILLRRYFEKPFETSEELIKKEWEKLPIPDDWDAERLPARVQEQRSIAQDAVLKLMDTVKDIPDNLKLKPGDLPKVSKHMEGNQTAVSDIIASLGVELYPSLFSLDTENDETEETE